MTMNEFLAVLAATTALRVFLPDLHTGMRRVLRAGARIGVAELLQTRSTTPGDAPFSGTGASQDMEA
ncbi:hypothetical protein ACQEV9_00055 [Streptomyces chartreusis]|uniref:hypothetical protein n=1 Tax=Streptomyces chartreusis TaxID=1969 RepID=UPI003D8E351E